MNIRMQALPPPAARLEALRLAMLAPAIATTIGMLVVATGLSFAKKQTCPECA